MQLKKIVPGILCLAAIVGVESKVLSQNIQPAVVPLNQGVVPQGVDPNSIIENPAPVFTDNSSLPASAFDKREEILSKLNLGTDSKLIGLTLEKWGEQPRGGIAHLISNGRQVWHLEYETENYNHTRLGLIKRARISQEYDADTGELLHSKITVLEAGDKMSGRPYRTYQSFLPT